MFALVEAYRGDPSDLLGSWVLTLTAHSDVLQRYDGGDGRVALRLSNVAIAGIVRWIGLAAIRGTPVWVRA